ncbi:MAG TPA: rhombosortase, partial [Pseudidiomarina sp.]|nr:rhombosortase [Pseudidiomarina sp.]
MIKWRQWWVNLPFSTATLIPISVVSLVLLVLYYWGQWTTSLDALVYHRMWIVAGESWRILTGALVHHDQPHLWLNILGLWLWWLLFIEHLPTWRDWLWLPVLLLSSTLAMFWLDPQTQVYAGFSGALYGLYAWGAVADTFLRRWSGTAIGIGLLVKCTYDTLYLPSTTDIAFMAHWGGIVAGIT